MAMGEQVKDVWCGRVDGRVPWQVCSAATAGGRQETLAYNQATAIFLDGTNIYMTLATLFLAQATNWLRDAGRDVSDRSGHSHPVARPSARD